MVRFLVVLVLAALFFSCDSQRVYETNKDFDDGFWSIKDTAKFVFAIDDTTQAFNVLVNIRNSGDYKTARLFMNYSLSDSSGNLLNKKLLEVFLFDRKTGEPFGESGIGDIFEHQLLTESSKHFTYKGRYTIQLNQAMRADTLAHILSVGTRVERIN